VLLILIWHTFCCTLPPVPTGSSFSWPCSGQKWFSNISPNKDSIFERFACPSLAYLTTLRLLRLSSITLTASDYVNFQFLMQCHVSVEAWMPYNTPHNINLQLCEMFLKLFWLFASTIFVVQIYHYVLLLLASLTHLHIMLAQVNQTTLI
jgi:hypothetical protein